MNDDLEKMAASLVAKGKGILAADESVPTLTKRFDALAIPSTKQSRRIYRDMLFTAPGASLFISGVILHDETIRQESIGGVPFAAMLSDRGILPGIKVDLGAKPLAGCAGETVTEGLDGLRDRLADYRRLGARFAKWRALIRVNDTLPSSVCIGTNAHALARYAALCQDGGLVPVVEPEVLMTGSHTIARCEAVTGVVLHAVFDALFEQGVCLEAMLLTPNMIVPGMGCAQRVPVDEVAAATMRCLRRHVPAAVPGIVFLSGGQDDVSATIHLNAVNQLFGPKPWKISFSFGRALQDAALEAWRGRDENLQAGRQAFYQRARCNSVASLGNYIGDMEQPFLQPGEAQRRHEWQDD